MNGKANDAAHLDRVLTIELARVTEQAAVAAALFRGRGDEMAADQSAVDAMRSELNRLDIDGTVVIGEGERDEAPMLFIGEKVGSGHGAPVDIALDPLEGSTLCAKNLPNAITAIAVAVHGSLLKAPDVYMDKIAVGPGYPEDIVSLERSVEENLNALAAAKGVPVTEVTVCVLDRPRHAQLIEEVRSAGAAIRLIGDGDVAGVIHTAEPDDTGIDIYMGIGGAPEGVLAAAALRCIGGQMQGRLQLTTNEKRVRAEKMGISDPYKIYRRDELASGDIIFAATGVTDGNFLNGVKFHRTCVETETIVMRSQTQTVRRIRAKHYDRSKFGF
ncbi:class II fructose-bisphosphatase [Consotaella aegiceratis]|uniref:class II fructose-bisphosphatase n=1 Tax=Consotaella aegiceratis TaxID=3097961 RepID=UPI002F41F88F